MDVSGIHGRTHSRLVNRRQCNSGTRNGSRRFHANHAMIMNEIRSILGVFRQGIDVQRLKEDVSNCERLEWSKVRCILGKSASEIEYDDLTDWRVVIRLLVWDKLFVRYMLAKVEQAIHHLVCISKTHTLDVHCLFARLVKLLAVCRKNI
jgi:hypothetical protein